MLNKTSKEIEILEKAVTFLNVNLFDNQLSKIKVTISPDTKSKENTYGWVINNIWSNGEHKYHELNITSNNLMRSFKHIWITLVHELIHMYGICNDIQTTSRQGRYHGKEFKKLCDRFYLIAEKCSTWGHTTPHDKFLPEQECLYDRFVRTLDVAVEDFFRYERLRETSSTNKSVSKTSKYECEECEISFTAKQKLDLICGKCENSLKEFVRE